MKRKLLLYSGFFVVLVLGFFMVMSWAIPGFNKPHMPPIGLLRPFALTTQNGTPFTEKNMQGKVVAVYYFFTTCKGICPRINHNMQQVYETYKNEPRFLLAAHTCDPEIDSVARLKKYADSLGVDTKRWTFITGRKDSLYALARQVYKIDGPANNVTDSNSDFLHSQFVALVNKQGEVIKIYDALKPSELKEMDTDIKTELAR